MVRTEIEKNRRKLILVRGGGDLATGTIHRLWSAGFPVMVLECQYPSAIRREASVCEAIYDGEKTVEGMRAVRISSCEEIFTQIGAGNVPVLVDPAGESIRHMKPMAVVDAILAKKNLGTRRDMAPLVIGLGPGFIAGEDVDAVVETMRGHNLGRIIRSGGALPDTGVPGQVGGYGKERVLHSPSAGDFYAYRRIGDLVKKNEAVAEIREAGGTHVPILTQLSGVLRGILRNGYPVTKGFKVADVDPRETERENCYTISDKSRCIAGSVLELCVRTWLTMDECGWTEQGVTAEKTEMEV